MKKLFLTFLAAVLLAGPAMAQDHHHRHHGHHHAHHGKHHARHHDHH